MLWSMWDNMLFLYISQQWWFFVTHLALAKIRPNTKTFQPIHRYLTFSHPSPYPQQTHSVSKMLSARYEPNTLIRIYRNTWSIFLPQTWLPRKSSIYGSKWEVTTSWYLGGVSTGERWTYRRCSAVQLHHVLTQMIRQSRGIDGRGFTQPEWCCYLLLFDAIPRAPDGRPPASWTNRESQAKRKKQILGGNTSYHRWLF